MRVKAIGVITSIIVLLLSAGLPTARGLEANFCSSSQKLHNIGLYYEKTYVQSKEKGIEGDLELRPGLACQGTGSFSYAWVMLTDADGFSATAGAHAQIGYFFNADSGACQCYRYAWEWDADDSTNTSLPFRRGVWGSPQMNSVHTFQVYVDGSGNFVMLGPDGASPPNNQLGYAPTTAEVAGNEYAAWEDVTPEMGSDIVYKQSDIMGTNSDRQTFSAIDLRNAGGTWIHNDPKLLTDWANAQTNLLCFMNRGVPGNNYFNLWTQPLNHAC